jgi:hypothetical protein
MEYAESKRVARLVLGEAVVTAVYILNRVPCKAVDGKTPFEVWYGRKPVVHHLKTFGCIVYVKNMKPNLKKLEDRGRKMIFVGYERGSKAYRTFDPLTSRVTITRDVVFDESMQWEWTGGNEGGGEINHHDDMFTVQYKVLHGEGEGGELEVGNGDLEAEPMTPPVTSGVGNHMLVPGGSPVELPVGLREEDLDADHDDAPFDCDP